MGRLWHAMRVVKWVPGLATALLALAVMAWLGWRPAGPMEMSGNAQPPSKAKTPVHFVGTPTCAQCHATEQQAWQGSHHDKAMQAATPATVLAPFRGEHFSEAGVTSTFSQRNDRFYVHTEGSDGRLHDFEVTHTLGFTPLQQYLIPMQNKGMQALTIAWDSRPHTQGGQRWFHLQKGQHMRPGEDLH